MTLECIKIDPPVPVKEKMEWYNEWIREVEQRCGMSPTPEYVAWKKQMISDIERRKAEYLAKWA